MLEGSGLSLLLLAVRDCNDCLAYFMPEARELYVHDYFV